MPLYGPNQIVTQAVRAAERPEYHRLPQSQLFPPVVVLPGPPTVLLVPVVFGRDGSVIEGGLHPPAHHVAVATQPPEGRANASNGPHSVGMEFGMAALVVFVVVGRRVHMRIVGIDPETGTWRDLNSHGELTPRS